MSSTQPSPRTTPAAPARQIKVVVWDLDETIWDGVLLEGGGAALRAGVADVIRTLDERGILQSIASRNEPEPALARLAHFGIDDYFLAPHIGWSAKSHSVRAIAEALNLGLDAFAFVDDQPFEREEVTSALPEVLALDAADLASLLTMPELMPRFVTADSRNRRRLYQSDLLRARDRDAFAGPDQAYLDGLGLRFRVAPACEGDLERAEELTVRTHQLNATGVTYSHEELDAFRCSDDHLLLVASLEDRFGSYGTIGLALIERHPELWTLKLLLMSCRVMSRGVGAVLLNHVLRLASAAAVRLQAEFVPTDRNRVMYVTYKFAGFSEVSTAGPIHVLEHSLASIPGPPSHVELIAHP